MDELGEASAGPRDSPGGPSDEPRDPRRLGWPAGLSLAGGVVYGLLLRQAFTGGGWLGSNVATLSIGFLLLLPFAVGYLVSHGARRPSWTYSLFMPWLVCLLFLAVSLLLAWEGSICVLMAAPALFVASSLGGVADQLTRLRLDGRSRNYVLVAVLLLPLVVAPLEARWTPPTELRQTLTETVVAARPETVWREVRSVRRIEEREQGHALYLVLGFPRPVEAQLSGTGVGAVRHAVFEGGLVFVETITAWEPPRLLRFSIHADPETIPSTTLDPHVTVGGKTFDVLEGWYAMEAVDSGHTRIRLGSRYRLSTTVNLYAGPWAHVVMNSVQHYILAIVARRCEAAETAAAGPGIG